MPDADNAVLKEYRCIIQLQEYVIPPATPVPSAKNTLKAGFAYY